MRIAFPLLAAAAVAACSNPSPDQPTPPGELPPQQQPAADPAAAATAATAATAAPAKAADGPAQAPAPAASNVLEGVHWQLAAASDARGAPLTALQVPGQPPLQLDFADGRLSVSQLCNGIVGSYSFDGTQLALGRMAATRRACVDPARAAQDRAAQELLSGHFRVGVQHAGPQQALILDRHDGARASFRGVADPAAGHAGPAETLFLEVAAQEQPCSHPLKARAQCPQVRELRFGSDGLRQGEPGPWQPLYEAIDGYTHQAGVRNVLRVKRYTRDPVPADASRYAYVLDLVVETGPAPP